MPTRQFRSFSFLNAGFKADSCRLRVSVYSREEGSHEATVGGALSPAGRFCRLVVGGGVSAGKAPPPPGGGSGGMNTNLSGRAPCLLHTVRLLVAVSGRHVGPAPIST